MRIHHLAWAIALLCALPATRPASAQQLDDRCTITVQNHAAQVAADGSWRIDNLPVQSPVRARATCIQDGKVTSGSSDLITLSQTQTVGIDADILHHAAVLIPSTLTIATPTVNVTQAGQVVPLTVTGTFAGSASRNLTASASGTMYRTSNPAIATISTEGVVTAAASGTVLIQAANEGTQGMMMFNIVLSGDMDGDGIPDDVEIRLGLNPNDPSDALDDPDHDGLNNLEEFKAGTDIHNPDSDGDGLTDGREVKVLHTNPLLRDTDGDGVPDNIEVATGSDPNNSGSVNLAAALGDIKISPTTFSISISGGNEISAQELTVTGDFKLGGSIDLTPRSKGTTYTSSNNGVCAFSNEDGVVTGVSSGSCVVTVVNSGFTATASGTVTSFNPLPLSMITVPGYPNSVNTANGFAYVASGEAGLSIFNVSNPALPTFVTRLDTNGNANDVRVVGSFAYIAGGAAGLQIIDVSNPAKPDLIGVAQTPGEALDVMIFNNRAYVADGGMGLSIIDVTDPTNPTLIKQVPTQGTVGKQGRARGVDILQGTDNKLYALVIETTNTATPSVGLRVVEVTDAANASVVANLPMQASPQDIRVAGNIAYIPFTGVNGGGLTVVDVTNPLSPVVLATAPGSFETIELSGNQAFPVPLFFLSQPVFNVSNPANPVNAGSIPFIQGGIGQVMTGTGVSVAGPLVYVTASTANPNNVPGEGDLGGGNLYIGQFTVAQDPRKIPPTATITAPAANASVVRGSTLTLRAAATDDVGVASVTFQVNGADFSTDDAAPYEALFTVPANATSLTIVAKATDFGGNSALSSAITLTAIEDPHTTITGHVVNADNSDAGGASVSCLNLKATTDVKGRFTVAALPTTKGFISCTATLGTALQAQSAPVEPAPGGSIDIGTLSLHTDQLMTITGSVERLGVTLDTGQDVNVTCQDVTVVTGFIGNFTIPGLSTRKGDIACSATQTFQGHTFQGTFGPWKPVEGGVLNVGLVVIR